MDLFAPLPRRKMALWCASLVMGALLCALIQSTLVWGQAGQALQRDTLRLHVRASSDSVQDQTAKLWVRDAVLALADAVCPAGDEAQAKAWAARSLPRVELEAQRILLRAGMSGQVRVRLVNMYFDTARYTGGTLPAGRYDALRVELGDGHRYGKNWWCVLYPGLCRSACGGYAKAEENDLVCGKYIVRFKLVDWWQRRSASRADKTLLSL